MVSSYQEIFFTPPKVGLRTSIFTQQRHASFTHPYHLSHSEPDFTENSLIRHVNFVLSKLSISETPLEQFQLETTSWCKKWPHSANFDHLENSWMARKAPHTHRFTPLLYPPQWYYFLWRYPSEKWANHSTHYPSSRNEISYLPTKSRDWKLQKPAREWLLWPLMESEIEEMIEICPIWNVHFETANPVNY